MASYMIGLPRNLLHAHLSLAPARHSIGTKLPCCTPRSLPASSYPTLPQFSTAEVWLLRASAAGCVFTHYCGILLKHQNAFFQLGPTSVFL